jgi:hypothetical protein
VTEDGMRQEGGGPRDLTSRAHGLVLREPNGVPPLAVALFPSSLS